MLRRNKPLYWIRLTAVFCLSGQGANMSVKRTQLEVPVGAGISRGKRFIARDRGNEDVSSIWGVWISVDTADRNQAWYKLWGCACVNAGAVRSVLPCCEVVSWEIMQRNFHNSLYHRQDSNRQFSRQETPRNAWNMFCLLASCLEGTVFDYYPNTGCPERFLL